MTRAFAIALLALGAPAAAQTACMDRNVVVGRLADRYGETLQGSGIVGGNVLFEVFASDETGTWTILATRTDGQTCMMAAGQEWSAEPQGDPS